MPPAIADWVDRVLVRVLGREMGRGALDGLGLMDEVELGGFVILLVARLIREDIVRVDEMW